MKATIWHNPRCGTSRKTLEILETVPDLDLQVVEYLKDPPSADELRELYAAASMSPRGGVRWKEAGAAALADADDEAILAAMVADPILIERPLVRTERGVRLCRPQARVEEIL